MEAAQQCISHLEFLEANGSVMAVSDVGVAVQFIRTALTGAVMNVYINTKSMKQRNEAEKINQKAEKLLEEGTPEEIQQDPVVIKAYLGDRYKQNMARGAAHA